MRILQNVLYVTTPDAYLALEGENVVVQQGRQERLRVPLHNLEGIVTFGYVGASPALMGTCAKRQIALTFLSAHGRFLARVVGESQGNVALRKDQYRISDSEVASTSPARGFTIGKLFNARSVIERAIRDYPKRLDTDALSQISAQLALAAHQVKEAPTHERIRGIEGEAAVRYFSAFDDLILQQKEAFFFSGRNRRPPMDRVNALLSFLYTLLAHEAGAALETVGLDSYIGFLHRDRPGRQSLALDLMEELRPALADRFVLTLINTRQVAADDFLQKESGGIYLTDEGRKKVLTSWQKRKQETIRHPFLGEKIPWGLVPYVQALLLARFLRGELDEYPPFLWK